MESFKIILITGAARGIGHYIATHFSSNPTIKIYSLDILKPVSPISNVVYLDCDLADEKSIETTINKIEEKKLDVLINNAALSKFENIESLSISEFDRILAVNLRAPFILSKFCLPLLKSASFPSIINIASTRALMSEKNNEAYSASKGGIVALTHALANSLGPKIRVNCISPGWINVSDSPESESDKSQHPVGRVGKGQDIAELAGFLADENKSGFITGQNFVVDGGMTKKMIYTE